MKRNVLKLPIPKKKYTVDKVTLLNYYVYSIFYKENFLVLYFYNKKNDLVDFVKIKNYQEIKILYNDNYYCVITENDFKIKFKMIVLHRFPDDSDNVRCEVYCASYMKIYESDNYIKKILLSENGDLFCFDHDGFITKFNCKFTKVEKIFINRNLTNVYENIKIQNNKLFFCNPSLKKWELWNLNKREQIFLQYTDSFIITNKITKKYIIITTANEIQIYEFSTKRLFKLSSKYIATYVSDNLYVTYWNGKISKLSLKSDLVYENFIVENKNHKKMNIVKYKNFIPFKFKIVDNNNFIILCSRNYINIYYLYKHVNDGPLITYKIFVKGSNICFYNDNTINYLDKDNNVVICKFSFKRIRKKLIKYYTSKKHSSFNPLLYYIINNKNDKYSMKFQKFIIKNYSKNLLYFFRTIFYKNGENKASKREYIDVFNMEIILDKLFYYMKTNRYINYQYLKLKGFMNKKLNMWLEKNIS